MFNWQGPSAVKVRGEIQILLQSSTSLSSEMPVRLHFRTRWNGKPSREFQQGRFPLANFRSLWSRMRKAFAIRLFYPFKKATSISYIWKMHTSQRIGFTRIQHPLMHSSSNFLIFIIFYHIKMDRFVPILALFLMGTFPPKGFSQILHDGSGRTVCRFDGDRISDGSGRALGRLDGDRVCDASGRTLGRLDGDRVTDASGRTLGYVQSDRLTDASGRTVARLEGDRLTDATGRTIARPQGLRRRQVIAYYYFFW